MFHVCLIGHFLRFAPEQMKANPIKLHLKVNNSSSPLSRIRKKNLKLGAFITRTSINTSLHNSRIKLQGIFDKQK